MKKDYKYLFVKKTNWFELIFTGILFFGVIYLWVSLYV